MDEVVLTMDQTSPPVPLVIFRDQGHDVPPRSRPRESATLQDIRVKPPAMSSQVDIVKVLITLIALAAIVYAILRIVILSR